MLRITLSALVTALLALGVDVGPARAQPARVFVAAQGSDGNPCSFAQPCRTFQHAHDVVAAKGEIDVLDPAGYGVLTITKAISIQGHGFSGISVPSGGTGVTINAGVNDAVNLTGVLIEGNGAGFFGISFLVAGSLTIEQSMVRNIVKTGISLSPSVSSTITISDTFVANNSYGLGYLGIILFPSGATTVTATFNRVELYNNGLGGIVIDGGNSTGTVRATVLDSVAAHHVNTGFAATSAPTGAAVTLSILRSTAAHNGGVGIFASGRASILVGQSVGTQNLGGNAQAVSPGKIFTYTDNYFDGAGCTGCTVLVKE